MKRIVIGVDGSEAAATAARWGAGLAAAAGADVVVATSFASQLGVPRQDRLPVLDELTDRFTDHHGPLLRRRAMNCDQLPPRNADAAQATGWIEKEQHQPADTQTRRRHAVVYRIQTICQLKSGGERPRRPPP